MPKDFIFYGISAVRVLAETLMPPSLERSCTRFIKVRLLSVGALFEYMKQFIFMDKG